MTQELITLNTTMPAHTEAPDLAEVAELVGMNDIDWRDCFAIRTRHGATLVRIGDSDLWTDLEDGFQFSPDRVETFEPTPLLDGKGMPVVDYGGRIVTELPDLVATLDAIDLQLAADSDEVVLPRDHAQLLAALLTDLLNPREWRGTRAPEAHTQPQRTTS